MEIAVIRLSSMGDVILCAPLFVHLKAAYPQCRISFFTSSRYAALFLKDPHLAAVVAVDSDSNFTSENRHAWDLIIDIQDNRRSRKVIAQLEPSKKLCRIDKERFKRLLLTSAKINLYGKENHVVNRYIKAATGNFLKLPAIPPLTLFADASLDSVSGVVSLAASGKPLFALLPFAAWRNKQWPLEFYAAVGSALSKKGYRIVILGGPDDVKKSQTLCQKIGGDVVDTTGTLSLIECAALLRKCTGALGNDSGLIHLARGCGVPTGIIYGATTRHLGFYPYGDPGTAPQYRVFEAHCFCRPCHAHGGDFCFRIFRPCLRRIAPERVVQELGALMKQA